MASVRTQTFSAQQHQSTFTVFAQFKKSLLGALEVAFGLEGRFVPDPKPKYSTVNPDLYDRLGCDGMRPA
jgi:hypothetical protein